jgi:hypothetical protein
MSVGLNASQARSKSREDITIYNEVSTIMLAVITASAAGEFVAYVDDGTTMTESSPTEVVTGTVANPTINVSDSIILGTTTIVLGTTGTSLNAIIADINDAGVTGVVASKNATNNLVLTFTGQPSAVWTYEIGAGTANTALGLTTGVANITTPSSVNYFQTWQGTRTNRGESQQMDQVIAHFQNMGFKIERTTNTTSQNTYQWNLYW